MTIICRNLAVKKSKERSNKEAGEEYWDQQRDFIF